MRVSARDALAADVEAALGRYMATDSFPTDQFPVLARVFADLVDQSEVTKGLVSPTDVAYNARVLVQLHSEFTLALSKLVE